MLWSVLMKSQIQKFIIMKMAIKINVYQIIFVIIINCFFINLYFIIIIISSFIILVVFV